ncbi:MAG: hypothetical protein RIA71_05905 [Oceanicaulis sp.]
MALFMLRRHDEDRVLTRTLIDAEIDAVAGGDGNASSVGEDPASCDTTMCNCTVITPGGDGEPMMDCDGG